MSKNLLTANSVHVIIETVPRGTRVVSSFERMIEMRSRIIANIAVVTFVAFALLLIVPCIAWLMHIGEPSYYHVARVDCLVAATACALVSFVSAIVAAHI